MIVLGLSFNYHDSAAALVVDGKIIAACEEERFCRRKHTAEYPELAIEYVLREAGITLDQVTHIAFYEKPIVKFDRILRGSMAAWPRSLVPFTSGLRQWISHKLNVVRSIKKKLDTNKPIACVPHHVSHAASTYYPSDFDEAAILTMDGVGEWATTGIGVGEGSRFNMLKEIRYPHSIGLLYSTLTSYLGFKVNDAEWKVMGLAPYGQPKYLDQFRKVAHLKDDGSFRLDLSYFSHHYSGRRMFSQKWCDLFGRPMRDPESELEDFHNDIACSGQKFVEEIILNVACAARKLTGKNKLCIAGGVGLNSVANWRIRNELDFEDVFIQPAAGDDGGALGAACFMAHGILGEPLPGKMRHAYYGPGYSQDEVESYLKDNNIPHETYATDNEVCERTAELIADNKVVGWFQGRQEFGPRALGHRSILGNPANPEMKDIINAKVKYREAFRPFAPSVDRAKAHLYFEMPEGMDLPYMLMVPQVRAEYHDKLPAITHHDGSGRVQTVTAEDNGIYHTLLQEIEKKLELPVVINTSFNVRGEPIVTTPQDGYDCFCRTGIDAFVVGRCVVTEKPSTVDHEAGMRHSVELEEMTK